VAKTISMLLIYFLLGRVGNFCRFRCEPNHNCQKSFKSWNALVEHRKKNHEDQNNGFKQNYLKKLVRHRCHICGTIILADLQMIEWHAVSHGSFSEYMRACPKNDSSKEETENEIENAEKKIGKTCDKSELSTKRNGSFPRVKRKFKKRCIQANNYSSSDEEFTTPRGKKPGKKTHRGKITNTPLLSRSFSQTEEEEEGKEMPSEKDFVSDFFTSSASDV